MNQIFFTLKLGDWYIPVYSYGLFVIAALIITTLVLFYLLKKQGIKTRRTLDNILWTILGGIVGARVVYVLFHVRHYINNWGEIGQFWQGGMSFFGMLLGAGLVLVGWLYTKKRREIWQWLDSVAIAGSLGHAIGMIGALVVGSNYGKPATCATPFKIMDFPDMVWRYPTQIYEIIAALCAFIILALLFEKKHWQKGKILMFGLIFFGVSRFVIEFFRTPDIILIGKFTLAHLLNLIIALVGIFGLYWLKLRNTKK